MGGVDELGSGEISRRGLFKLAGKGVAAGAAASLGMRVGRVEAQSVTSLDDIIAADPGSIEERSQLAKEVLGKAKTMHEANERRKAATKGNEKMAPAPRHSAVCFDRETGFKCDVRFSFGKVTIDLIIDADPLPADELRNLSIKIKVSGEEDLTIYAFDRNHGALGDVMSAFQRGEHKLPLRIEGKSVPFGFMVPGEATPEEIRLAERLYKGAMELLLSSG